MGIYDNEFGLLNEYARAGEPNPRLSVVKSTEQGMSALEKVFLVGGAIILGVIVVKGSKGEKRGE